MKMQIILGSTREGRYGERVAKWVFSEALKRTDFKVELIDLRDFNLPFYQESKSVTSLNGNYSVDIAKKWSEKIQQGDGYIIITPEYNHSFPAVLKNALDYLYSEWNKKPVSFVSYGGSASGARAVEQLRLVAIELQLAPIREAIHFPLMYRPFDEVGELQDESFNIKLGKMFDQLIWWARALKEARYLDQSANSKSISRTVHLPIAS